MRTQLYLQRLWLNLTFKLVYLFHLCLRTVDPPYAPLKDRMVSNLTLEGNMTAQQDNRFTVTLTWNPPVYPYKKPFMYILKWFNEDSLEQTGPTNSVSQLFFSAYNISSHLTTIFYSHFASNLNFAPSLSFVKQFILPHHGCRLLGLFHPFLPN